MDEADNQKSNSESDKDNDKDDIENSEESLKDTPREETDEEEKESPKLEEKTESKSFDLPSGVRPSFQIPEPVEIIENIELMDPAELTLKDNIYVNVLESFPEFFIDPEEENLEFESEEDRIHYIKEKFFRDLDRFLTELITPEYTSTGQRKYPLDQVLFSLLRPPPKFDERTNAYYQATSSDPPSPLDNLKINDFPVYPGSEYGYWSSIYNPCTTESKRNVRPRQSMFSSKRKIFDFKTDIASMFKAEENDIPYQVPLQTWSLHDNDPASYENRSISERTTTSSQNLDLANVMPAQTFSSPSFPPYGNMHHQQDQVPARAHSSPEFSSYGNINQSYFGVQGGSSQNFTSQDPSEGYPMEDIEWESQYQGNQPPINAHQYNAPPHLFHPPMHSNMSHTGYNQNMGPSSHHPNMGYPPNMANPPFNPRMMHQPSYHSNVGHPHSNPNMMISNYNPNMGNPAINPNMSNPSMVNPSYNPNLANPHFHSHVANPHVYPPYNSNMNQPAFNQNMMNPNQNHNVMHPPMYNPHMANAHMMHPNYNANTGPSYNPNMGAHHYNPHYGNHNFNPNMANPQFNPHMTHSSFNPNVMHPPQYNQNMPNPNQHMVNPQMVNPQMVNPHMANQHTVNPHMPYPHMMNPQMANPNMPNSNMVPQNMVYQRNFPYHMHHNNFHHPPPPPHYSQSENQFSSRHDSSHSVEYNSSTMSAPLMDSNPNSYFSTPSFQVNHSAMHAMPPQPPYLTSQQVTFASRTEVSTSQSVSNSDNLFTTD